MITPSQEYGEIWARCVERPLPWLSSALRRRIYATVLARMCRTLCNDDVFVIGCHKAAHMQDVVHAVRVVIPTFVPRMTLAQALSDSVIREVYRVGRWGRAVPFLLAFGGDLNARDGDGWTAIALASSSVLHGVTLTTTIELLSEYCRHMSLLLDAASTGDVAITGADACLYYEGVRVVAPPPPSSFGVAVACTPSEFFARMRRQFPANGPYRDAADIIQARLCSLEAYAVSKLVNALSDSLRLCFPIVQMYPIIASYA
jgi:hypothetical protein